MAQNNQQGISIKNEFNNIFIEQSPNAIAMFDKDMRYITSSFQWRADNGITNTELLNVSYYDIFPEIGEKWASIHQKCLKGAVYVCDDATFSGGEGDQQWTSWNIRPWFLSKEEIGGLIIFTQDITERKKLDEKLRVSEEGFRGAFEHAAIGMAIVDISGKWLRINNSLSAMLGYTAQEIQDLSFQDITYPEDLHKDLILLNELIAGTREFYEMEKRYIHKKGNIVWAILAVSLVRDREGNPLHFISQITDISRIKAAEADIRAILELANDQNGKLTNFAHIVSHNLRAHSGNFSMLLDFIESDTEISPAQQELFQMLRVAASNLDETVGHLNEVVAVSTAIDHHLVEVNLYHAVKCATGNVEALLKATGVTSFNEVDPKIQIEVVPAYLDSILLNFLTNAIKYRSDERKPHITFSTNEVDSFYVLSISDNGLGIDLNLNRDDLFGMYKTFHGNKDAKGIGLYITRNQIEAMGGKISVESEINVGTTFRIYFKKSS